MAAIKNSIQLQDRMTPVFRSIIKSMDSTLKVMKNLDKQASHGQQSKAYQRARADVDKATSALQKMQNQITQANNQAERLSSTMGKVSSNATAAASGMRNMGTNFSLVNLSAAVYLLENIKDLISSIMEGPDIAISTKARLGLFNESTYSKDELYDQLYQMSLDTRTGLEETGNLVTRVMISGAMTGENSAVGALKAGEIINKALIAGGGTSEENRRSLLQLSQGLASGMLQGDELRAIREQTPYLTDIIAQGLGRIDERFAGATIGDLKQLGKEGELTSDRILKALFAMEDEVDNAFKQMPRTFGQATTQLRSMWMYFLDSLNTTDGAIGKINAKIWQFVDYLQTADGEKFMNSLATGINSIVSALLLGIDVVSKAVTWLLDNGNALQAVLMAVGTAATVGAAAMFAGFMAAYGPLVLVLAGLSAMYYMALESGETTGSMAGKIVTYFILAGNRIVLAAVVIFTALEFMSTYLMLAIYAIVDVIWDVILALAMAVMTVVGLVVAGIQGTISNISKLFNNMTQGLLDSLSLVAKAMDAIFGTNTAKAIEGWKNQIKGMSDTIVLTMESEIPILNPETWKDMPWADFDNTDKLRGGELLDFMGMYDRNNAWNTIDDEDAWAIGNNLGKGIDDGLANNKYDVEKQYNDFLKTFAAGDLQFAGGNLDSVDEVGKIGSSVDLSEEDIRLLRDISAKQFLIQLNTIEPQVTATFGDINNNTDIEDIMGELEQMILDAAATSLND